MQQPGLQMHPLTCARPCHGSRAGGACIPQHLPSAAATGHPPMPPIGRADRKPHAFIHPALRVGAYWRWRGGAGDCAVAMAKHGDKQGVQWCVTSPQNGAKHAEAAPLWWPRELPPLPPPPLPPPPLPPPRLPSNSWHHPGLPQPSPSPIPAAHPGCPLQEACTGGRNGRPVHPAGAASAGCCEDAAARLVLPPGRPARQPPAAVCLGAPSHPASTRARLQCKTARGCCPPTAARWTRCARLCGRRGGRRSTLVGAARQAAAGLLLWPAPRQPLRSAAARAGTSWHLLALGGMPGGSGRPLHHLRA